MSNMIYEISLKLRKLANDFEESLEITNDMKY